MPCKDGVQCIREIRDDKAYDNFPIVVPTVSSQHNSIQAAYGLGANLYIIKPNEYAQLLTALRTILAMNWDDPKSITERYFHRNKYIPFTA